MTERGETLEKKYVLVPIATLGCGKTTVANALTVLCAPDMGHVQNDAIPSSKNKKRMFVEATKQLIKDHPVVFMDRNNAEKKERKQIFNDIQMPEYDIRFVALNFLPNGPDKRSRDVTRSLIFARGNNHATIRDMPESKVRMIVANFERRFQRADPKADPDSHFYKIINLRAGDSLPNIEKVLNILYELDALPGRQQHSKDEIHAAYKSALSYKADMPGEPEEISRGGAP